MTLPLVSGEFRCVADPNLRFAPSGTAVATIRAVASSRKKNEAGDWVDDKTCWVNLTGFKKVAENMAESIQKGDLVTVIGKINTDDWEDNDGNKRTSINLIVDSIGPAIVFNAAIPQRSERRSSSESRQDQGSDPWTTPASESDEPPF